MTQSSPSAPFPAAGHYQRMDAPLGYGLIEPLRRDGWVRLLPAGQVPAMAAMLQAVPLVPDEFADAAAHYPIVLLPGAQDCLVPAALLGLRPGRNAFAVRTVRVTRWVDGVYVPAYLRRWPLCAATPQTPRNAVPAITVCVEAARQSNGPVTGSVRLFTVDGAINEQGQALISALHSYEDGLAQGRELAALWLRLGLVQAAHWSPPPMQPSPARPSPAVQLQGLWAIDPQALAQLSREAVFELHQQRAMAATHLAAESLTRFARVHARTVNAPQDWRAPPMTRRSARSGF